MKTAIAIKVKDEVVAWIYLAGEQNSKKGAKKLAKRFKKEGGYISSWQYEPKQAED